ncbi:MAG: 2-amino-4-hydroxy-6-hydroxymethyldihydropteridine diphosphokinase [Pseudomonadota bacterium]
MTTAIVALGANQPLGDRTPVETLDLALARLDGCVGMRISARSRWYRTPAFPAGSGPDFVNGAATLETDLLATEVLAAMHAIEGDLGRRRRERWAPRTCDLDLLGLGDTVLPDAETARRWMSLSDAEAQADAADRLILPHPRMQTRAFVLVPVCDVAPDWQHPLLGKTAREMRDELPPEALAEVSPL